MGIINITSTEIECGTLRAQIRDLRARLAEAEGERDTYRDALDEIAGAGCGIAMDGDDDCRTAQDLHPADWCWSCIAANAIGGGEE